MFRKANNVFSVILDDETIDSVDLPTAGTVMTDANLPNGAIAVVDLGMRLLKAATYNALSDSDQFMVIQGKGAGNPMVKSPAITKGNVTITSAAHVASAQQITVIGYNGASGTLPSANNTSYYVKVRKNDNDAANRSQPFSLFGQYETSGSASVTETAFGVAENLVKNMKDEPANGYLSVEVLSNGTAAVVSDGSETQDAIVVNGSTEITLVDTGTSTAGDTAGILAAIPAGSFVNIAGATYKVKSLNANVVTLTTPYVGASGTITGGTTVASQFCELTTITATGLRLTGVEAPFDVNKFRNFYVNRFTATFSDEDTLVTHVQGAREGIGVWQRVALDEYMSYGFDGMDGMIGVPPTLRDQVVKIPGVGGATAAKAKYSVVNISWTEDIDGLVSKAGGKGNVLAYVNLDGSGNLGGAGSTGETFVGVFGITAADLDE